MSSYADNPLKDANRNINDISILSDASFISIEEKHAPQPPVGDSLGKQVRFNSALAISSPHEDHRNYDRKKIRSSCLKQSESTPRRLLLEDVKIVNENAGEEPISSSPPLVRCYDVEDVSDSILDLSMVDDCSFQEVRKQSCPPCLGALSIGTPQYNTVYSLQQEVMQLEKRISSVSATMPSLEAREKALNHLTGHYEVSSQAKSPSLSISNIPVAVNFSRQDSVFMNLLEISVCESEIVRTEQVNIAKKRRQVLEMIKKNAKPEVLPEPCPMKFFDPQKHVFQSAWVHLTGMPNLVPELRPFPYDHLHLTYSSSESCF